MTRPASTACSRMSRRPPANPRQVLSRSRIETSAVELSVDAWTRAGQVVALDAGVLGRVGGGSFALGTAVERVARRRKHGRAIKRLGNEASRPQAQRGSGVRLMQRCRAHDHRQPRIDQHEVPQGREPIPAGHHQIQRHEIRAQLTHPMRRLKTVLRFTNDLMLPVAEDLAQQGPAQQVVINDQDSRHTTTFGRIRPTVTVRPPPWTNRLLPAANAIRQGYPQLDQTGGRDLGRRSRSDVVGDE